MRFDLNVTDIIYIDEYYSNYVANVGTIDALMDYVQNVMEYKYEEDHPLFALLTYPTKSIVNSIVGIAASIGGLCAPDQINVANGDLGKGTRSCITEFIGNSTDWPYEVNDESIEHTSRVSLSVSRCLKITEKVSFNIASGANYVYILSGQKFIKNAKKSQFGEFLKT